MLKELSAFARKERLEIDSHMSASSLSRRLQTHAEILRGQGIIATRYKKVQRHIHLYIADNKPAGNTNANNDNAMNQITPADKSQKQSKSKLAQMLEDDDDEEEGDE